MIALSLVKRSALPASALAKYVLLLMLLPVTLSAEEMGCDPADAAQCSGDHVICIPQKSGFSCDCEAGYVSSSGACVLPEEKPCEPDSRYCLHGGTCKLVRQPGGESYAQFCECDPDNIYTGARCEISDASRHWTAVRHTPSDSRITSAVLTSCLLLLLVSLTLLLSLRLRCHLRHRRLARLSQAISSLENAARLQQHHARNFSYDSRASGGIYYATISNRSHILLEHNGPNVREVSVQVDSSIQQYMHTLHGATTEI